MEIEFRQRWLARRFFVRCGPTLVDLSRSYRDYLSVRRPCPGVNAAIALLPFESSPCSHNATLGSLTRVSVLASPVGAPNLRMSG